MGKKSIQHTCRQHPHKATRFYMCIKKKSNYITCDTIHRHTHKIYICCSIYLRQIVDKRKIDLLFIVIAEKTNKQTNRICWLLLLLLFFFSHLLWATRACSETLCLSVDPQSSSVPRVSWHHTCLFVQDIYCLHHVRQCPYSSVVSIAHTCVIDVPLEFYDGITLIAIEPHVDLTHHDQCVHVHLWMSSIIRLDLCAAGNTFCTGKLSP